MRRSKKIFLLFCVTLCFSVTLMISTSAFTFRTTDYMIRGSIYDGYGDVPVLGTVTQYKADGSSKSVNFDYADAAYLYEDSKGVYGFKYYFPGSETGGFTDSGDYKLTVSIPWTDTTGTTYFGEHDTSYRIDSLDLYFSCGIFYLKNGEYVEYRLNSPWAQIVNVSNDETYSDPIAESTEWADNNQSMGDFHIHLNGGTVVKGKQNLNLEIRWKDKPSSNNKPYISFIFSRAASKLVASPLDIYLSDINSSIKDSFQKIKDYLAYDPLDYNKSFDPGTVSYMGDFLSGSGHFYDTAITWAVAGSTVAMMGYVIHGKR